MSCPYKRMDGMRQTEYCIMTDVATEGERVCERGYEYCPHYIEAQKPLNGGQAPGRTSCADKAGQRYIQTSIFGASGEVPIKE